MSEFHVKVVKLEQTQKHPNADSLSIATILGGYPVVYKTQNFNVGDKVVYIPIDSLVPLNNPVFEFLADGDKTKQTFRIKAKKLRGVFSMGMLVPADPSWDVGRNVQKELGIEKWEPQDNSNINAFSETEKDPGILPTYTDIYSLRQKPDILNEGEEVIITEKLHGSNARFVYANDEFWVGSHKVFKKRHEQNTWWLVANKYNLETKLKANEGIAIYGEIFGSVQDLKYGAKQGELFFAAFDVFNIKTGTYFDYDDMVSFCKSIDISIAPVLYRGPWNDSLKNLAEGKSTYSDHVREGFVVRPVKERFSSNKGYSGGIRVVFKLVGEGYLLRKEK